MTEEKKLFEEISKLSTEQKNPNSVNIDMQSTEEILSIINNEDKKVAGIISGQLEKISQAAVIFADDKFDPGFRCVRMIDWHLRTDIVHDTGVLGILADIVQLGRL